MQKMTDKINDKAIIAALICSPSIAEAAKSVQVSTRTIYRRLERPEFRNAYDLARNEVMDSTVKYMTVLSQKAVMRLGELLESKKEHVQLNAIKLIIQINSTLRREFEIEERLQILENEKKRRSFLSEE
jgi:transposase